MAACRHDIDHAPWRWFLREPKHVGAIFGILIVLIFLRFYNCLHQFGVTNSVLTGYSCLILIKLELSRQFFEKYSYIKFRENPSVGSRVVPCVRTDNFTNAPKNSTLYGIRRPPSYEHPGLHYVNQVRILSHCYLKIDCSSILLSIGVPSKGFHSLRFPTLKLRNHLFPASCAVRFLAI